MTKDLNFGWAANPSKLERAITELKEKGLPVTEEAVKAVYVRLAGKVLLTDAKPEATTNTAKPGKDSKKS